MDVIVVVDLYMDLYHILKLQLKPTIVQPSKKSHVTGIWIVV